MNKPLLSIIIATKNRAIYCFEAVTSILDILKENCELVIHDNSENSELQKLILNVNDSRLVYVHNKTSLSFVENFNQAMEYSSGKYFCILGDDDSITNDIHEIVKWMDDNNVDSVCSNSNVEYIWPNPSIDRYKSGELSIPAYTGKRRQLDLRKSLTKLIVQDGTLNYQSYCLPRTYHGLIKRDIFDHVKLTTGHYFGGLTPDIYSTIALACITKVHYVIDYPFTIAGACPASASVANMTGGHSGKLKDAPHFRNRGLYIWEKEIPKYYSVETIWAETALKALKEMGEVDLAKGINLYKFLTYGIFANRNYILKLSVKETMRLYQPLKMNKYNFYSQLFSRITYVVGIGLIKKTFNKLTVKKLSSLVQVSIKDLNQANLEVKKYLSQNQIKFDK